MADEAVDTRVLVLFAHPATHKSRVNRALSDGVRDLPGIHFHDLYEAYPDFDIQVEREQELVEAHQVIVWQHPLFWYSCPALLKEWQDLVLEHGWAYGREGTALHGKKLLSVITTGGSEDAYQPQGYNRSTMLELLKPISQTAWLCGMEYLPPFIVHGTHLMEPPEIETHAKDYRRVLEALRDERVDMTAVQGLTRLNADLSAVVKG